MSVEAEAKSAFEGWCILELMGHRRLGGYVREQEIAGQGTLRIDVPGADGEPMATQFYAPSALYCLTPTTEEIARGVARRSFEAPVQRWELPALAAPASPTSELCPSCDSEVFVTRDTARARCGQCEHTFVPLTFRDRDDDDDDRTS